MNLPMLDKTKKTIYAKVAGLQLPPRVKKLLLGAEIVWFDKDPLSQDFGEALHFFFDSKTSTMTDLLLRKHGFNDVSQFINIALKWRVEMDLVYSMPNRHDVDKVHTETMIFEFYGLMYPMHAKFIENRDKFYLARQVEFGMVADDHKNKKFFETTKFKAVVIGI